MPTHCIATVRKSLLPRLKLFEPRVRYQCIKRFESENLSARSQKELSHVLPPNPEATPSAEASDATRDY